METVKKEPEFVNVPKYYFKQEIKNQYNDVPLAIVRELIQNSRDAGAKNIWFEFEDGRFSCRDDGHGMTEEDFRKYYLNLGGTFKHTDSIGGFGAAKKLTFAADTWIVMGKDFLCEGEGNEFRITPSYLTEGLIVIGNDTSYKAFNFEQALKRICSKSKMPLVIWMNGQEIEQGRKLHHSQLLWDFGFARLYAPKKFEYSEFNETAGYQYIRTKGLLTTQKWVGSEYVYYLEIDSPLEILTENRESIREEYQKKIQEEIQAVIKKGIANSNEHKQITLYGIPKQRYTCLVQDTIPVYKNGIQVSNLSRTEYINETGEQDWAVEEELPKEEFVTEIDEQAIADLESINTELGLLRFAHKKLQFWDYPFAVIEDGQKAVQMFTRTNELTERARKCLTLTLTISKMLSTDLNIPCPVPAILFSNSAEGLNTKSGPYELVGILPEILMGEDNRGTPFGVLEVFIHEFAHHNYSGHSENYELERMRIARVVGSKVDVYLNIIKGLQNA